MHEPTCMPFVSEQVPVSTSGILYLCVCLSVVCMCVTFLSLLCDLVAEGACGRLTLGLPPLCRG